jgi:hypothetical protein
MGKKIKTTRVEISAMEEGRLVAVVDVNTGQVTSCPYPQNHCQYTEWQKGYQDHLQELLCVNEWSDEDDNFFML